MAQELQYEIYLDRPFNQTLEDVENALKGLGFLIITRVDVQRMMMDQLKVDFRPYVILGACDTLIAGRAMEIDPAIGLMLPCNIAIEATSDLRTWVRAADPLDSLGGRAAENPRLAELAIEAGQRISAVITYLHENTRPFDPQSKSWDRLAHEHHE